MYKLIELWDNIAYSLYNLFAYLCYALVDRFRYRIILKKAKKLRDIHKGERCFVILNGPSINSYDLRPLADEITFCVNQFFRTSQYDIIRPKYYCFWDSNIIYDDRFESVRDTFRKQVKPAKFLFNKKLNGLLPETEDIYYIYGMHMPTARKIHDDLGGLSSSFSNVGLFAILCAMYMGIKEIYLLGYDFSPRSFSNNHAYATLAVENQIYQQMFINANKICGCLGYWHYYLTQLQSYYLRTFADKKGCRIINLNPDSCIRAFEFGDYTDFFLKKVID